MPDRLTPQIVDAYETNGAFVIRGALNSWVGTLAARIGEDMRPDGVPFVVGTA